MLKHIAEEARYVEITGFKNVKVDEPEQLLKSTRSGKQASVAVQFFNADLIATWEHLYFAVLNALTAFRTKRNISKNPAVEVMLYASAQRQIKKAIELVGVKPGCADVAVVAVSDNPEVIEGVVASVSKRFRAEPDETVLELSAAKAQNIRRAFTITDVEMVAVAKKGDTERALVDLVIERMALLATRL
jgi:KEOPS complex subunit Cgi121